MNNNLVNKYIPIIDKISNKYNYNSNIKHLLYLIIPAFITKYTYKEERLIINTFKDTKIIISDKKDKNIQALYSSIPYHNNNLAPYRTKSLHSPKFPYIIPLYKRYY